MLNHLFQQAKPSKKLLIWHIMISSKRFWRIEHPFQSSQRNNLTDFNKIWNCFWLFQIMVKSQSKPLRKSPTRKESTELLKVSEPDTTNIFTRSKKRKWNKLYHGLKSLVLQVTFTSKKMCWKSPIVTQKIRPRKTKEWDQSHWSRNQRRLKRRSHQRSKLCQQTAKNWMKSWEFTQKWSTFQSGICSKSLISFQEIWLLLTVTLRQKMTDSCGALRKMRSWEKV